MKKIVGIIAALALAGSVFAGEPSVSPVIAEFKGDASLEWIANLDNETIGMKNSSSANFKVTFISEGTKATTGEGLWGELEIKEGKTEVEAKKGAAVTTISPFVAAPTVEKAIIHFVDDDFYASMDIKGPDLGLGGGKFVLATRSDSDSYANPKTDANNVGLPGPAQGFKINFGLKDLFDANFSFADDGEDIMDTKDFAFKFDATLKAVENLELYAGTAYSSFEEDVALAAKASYKLAIGDTMYIKPSVGFTLKDDAKNLAAALFFGWGAENKEPNFAKFSKATLVGDNVNIANKCSNGASIYLGTSNNIKDFNMIIAAYDDTLLGGILPGLAWAIDFEIPNLKKAGDAWTFDAALKYSNKFADTWTIDANFGLEVISVTVLDKTETKAGFLYGFGISTDNTFIQNTKLYAKYSGEHAEDIGAADLKGTITIGTQIHF